MHWYVNACIIKHNNVCLECHFYSWLLLPIMSCLPARHNQRFEIAHVLPQERFQAMEEGLNKHFSNRAEPGIVKEIVKFPITRS